MIRLARKIKRRVGSLLERQREKRQLSGLYNPDPDHLDLDAHLREAILWLERAQDAGTDRGVAYGTSLGDGFDVSYPETTGYICQTFVELEEATGNDQFLQRAVAMGDWEVKIQLPQGAVMGGKVNPEPTPAVFNTGMVLLGWSALIRRTGENRFVEAAGRAAEWLVSIQEDDGHWIRGHSDFAPPGSTLYNVMAAWGLAEAGLALREKRFIHAAEKNADYCRSHQHSNGWFPHACFSDPQRPLLHTLAYCMQGLLGVGKIAHRNDLISSASLLADAELRLMAPNGFLPGRQDADLRPAAKWACLTGSAQTSVVWSELFRITGDEKYRGGVQRVNRYLMARHDIRNVDPSLRGGVTGSWPVWGEYGRLMVLSWATKFLVDALRMEADLLEENELDGHQARS